MSRLLSIHLILLSTLSALSSSVYGVEVVPPPPRVRQTVLPSYRTLLDAAKKKAPDVLRANRPVQAATRSLNLAFQTMDDMMGKKTADEPEGQSVFKEPPKPPMLSVKRWAPVPGSN